MNRSFYNGISGVKTHQFGMDVWSNNIANINSIGYKYKNPEFSTIFAQQLDYQVNNPTSDDVGLGGVGMATTSVMNMGVLQSSDGKYDMAISGKGMFGVQDSSGKYFYTRDGAFNRDRNGNLVDHLGNFVLGQSANNISNGIITDNSVGDIKLTGTDTKTKIVLPQKLTLPAQRTTYVKMKGNLDSTPKYSFNEKGEKIEVPNIEIYRSEVINSKGDKDILEIKFTKHVPQGKKNIIWNAKATIKDKNGKILSTKDGTLTFDTRGAFLSNTLNSIDNDGKDIKLQLGTRYDANIKNSGWDGLISYSNSKVAGKEIQKDGYVSGNLEDYSIDSLGNIQAKFDNGRTVPIYKVMVFNFQNEEGLSQASPIYYKKTANSGDAILLKDKYGNVLNQNISTRHLEMSNVDMSTAMTELIVMQKAFDASSKSITTSDQMIQNAINMKK